MAVNNLTFYYTLYLWEGIGAIVQPLLSHFIGMPKRLKNCISFNFIDFFMQAFEMTSYSHVITFSFHFFVIMMDQVNLIPPHCEILLWFCSHFLITFDTAYWVFVRIPWPESVAAVVVVVIFLPKIVSCHPQHKSSNFLFCFCIPPPTKCGCWYCHWAEFLLFIPNFFQGVTIFFRIGGSLEYLKVPRQCFVTLYWTIENLMTPSRTQMLTLKCESRRGFTWTQDFVFCVSC